MNTCKSDSDDERKQDDSNFHFCRVVGNDQRNQLSTNLNAEISLYGVKSIQNQVIYKYQHKYYRKIHYWSREPCPSTCKVSSHFATLSMPTPPFGAHWDIIRGREVIICQWRLIESCQSPMSEPGPFWILSTLGWVNYLVFHSFCLFPSLHNDTLSHCKMSAASREEEEEGKAVVSLLLL